MGARNILVPVFCRNFSTTESITGIHIADKRTDIISASKRVMIHHFRRHQQQSYHEAQYSILYT